MTLKTERPPRYWVPYAIGAAALLLYFGTQVLGWWRP